MPQEAAKWNKPWNFLIKKLQRNCNQLFSLHHRFISSENWSRGNSLWEEKIALDICQDSLIVSLGRRIVNWKAKSEREKTNICKVLLRTGNLEIYWLSSRIWETGLILLMRDQNSLKNKQLILMRWMKLELTLVLSDAWASYVPFLNILLKLK